MAEWTVNFTRVVTYSGSADVTASNEEKAQEKADLLLDRLQQDDPEWFEKNHGGWEQDDEEITIESIEGA